MPRLSLRLKWSLLALLLAALPLLFLGLRSASVVEGGFRDSASSLEASIVHEVERGIDAQVLRAANVAARAGRVLGDDTIPQETRIALVKDLLSSEPLLDRLAIYDAQHAFIDELRQGRGNEPAVSPPTLPSPKDERNSLIPITWKGDTPVVQLVAPIGKDGTTTGFVLARLRDGAFDEVVRAATVSLGENGRNSVAIFSDEGKPLTAGGNLDRARRLLTSQGSAPDGVVARSGVLLGDERVTGSTLRRPLYGFTIVIARTEADAFPALFRARRELGLAFIAILLVALLVAAYVATRTTRPIATLVTLTEQYAKRNFSARSEVKTGDELETLGTSLTNMAGALLASDAEIARRATVEATLSRYLPEPIARSVAEGKGSLELGGQRKEVTALFADVVAFTSFSENASPEQVVSFLNELFGLLTEIVFRHEGIVDKFMGDCLMAVFGATKEHDHASAAMACAEDMHRFVDSMRKSWEEKYSFKVQLAIGVASGPAVVGNLGSEKRMEFTAIGDAVNVASRLETLARAGQTLVTKAVCEKVGSAFELRSLGEHVVRGKTDKLELFELVE